MESRFLTFVAASAVFMTVLLLLDRDGLAPQLALGIATALFLWYFARTPRCRRGRSSAASSWRPSAKSCSRSDGVSTRIATP